MTGDNRMTGNLNYQIVLKEKNVQLLFGSIDFVTQTILTLFPGFKYFHLVYSVARFSFRKDEFFWSYLFVMLTNCFIKPSHHASSMNACQAFPAKHTTVMYSSTVATKVYIPKVYRDRYVCIHRWSGSWLFWLVHCKCLQVIAGTLRGFSAISAGKTL